MRPPSFETDLELITLVVYGAAWIALLPASVCIPLPANATGQHLAASALAEQVDRRVLHRDLRADVAVDPLHHGVLVGRRALGHQVVDVGRPVLDRRVADPRALLRDDLHHRGVQRVARVDRRRASLDVVHVGALVRDDQRPLELAHVLGVDPEVGLSGMSTATPGGT